MVDSTAVTVPTEQSIAKLDAEGLADVLPYVATGVRVALETKDIAGKGQEWVELLAEIASRAEAQFLLWKKERAAEKAR